MGKQPNLETLDYLFEQDKDFNMSGRLYEELTGVPLPMRNSYTKSSSALARKADKLGYKIAEVKDTPIIEKTVYFIKK